MKKIVVVIALLFPIITNAQVMWQIKKNGNVKWFYQFGDEFNGSTLDETKWIYGMPWGNSAMSQELLFTNNNVVESDGSIKLMSNKEAKTIKLLPWQIDSGYLKKNNLTLPNQEFTSKYTAGLITTKQLFKYGYFEVRFKSAGQRGTWPAFWLYGGKPNEEIDFFELKGERDNQIHVDVHCPDGCNNFKGGFLKLHRGWGSWINTKNNLSEGWNVVSGEWQKDYVKIFLNGMPIAYFKGEFKTDQMLILNNSIAHNKGAFPPGPDANTKWPNSFEVDYVRVWSNADTNYKYQNDYRLFQNTQVKLENTKLYETELKKKDRIVYDSKALDSELGSITLLPISYNKFSLSVLGKNLGKVQIDVLDKDDKKVYGVAIENTTYYVLDLSNLPTGPYKVSISVLNQVLTHQIPILNPAKIGEQ